MNTVFNFLKKENDNKKLNEISLTFIHSLNLDLGKSTNCVFIRLTTHFHTSWKIQYYHYVKLLLFT